jgi:hypothetical protein
MKIIPSASFRGFLAKAISEISEVDNDLGKIAWEHAHMFAEAGVWDVVPTRVLLLHDLMEHSLAVYLLGEDVRLNFSLGDCPHNTRCEGAAFTVRYQILWDNGKIDPRCHSLDEWQLGLVALKEKENLKHLYNHLVDLDV